MKYKVDAKVIFYVQFLFYVQYLYSIYFMYSNPKSITLILHKENTFRNLPKDTQITRAGAMLEARIFD